VRLRCIPAGKVEERLRWSRLKMVVETMYLNRNVT
jgi:hypothetical protein